MVGMDRERMDPQELRAWLRLVLTPRVGLGTARKLLAALGSPQAIFATGPEALSTVVGAREARALQTEPDGLDDQVRDTLSWLAGADDSSEGPMAPREVISLADARYPAALLEAADPPLLLFTQGRLDLLSAPAVALVGSRHATPQGVDNARAFAQALSEAGLTVISGLADGIDGAAHARGTLVVEAAVQSGSLITARLASEMGREVFAIPGSIHSPQARGCHALIKQGAKLVETAQDVMDELNWGHSSTVAATGAQILSLNDDGGAEGDPVLDAMGFDPVSQDALSARTGMGPAELGARLLELELDGRVARLPGQLFQRVARA
jgi:DNA processing protein